MVYGQPKQGTNARKLVEQTKEHRQTQRIVKPTLCRHEPWLGSHRIFPVTSWRLMNHRRWKTRYTHPFPLGPVLESPPPPPPHFSFSRLGLPGLAPTSELNGVGPPDWFPSILSKPRRKPWILSSSLSPISCPWSRLNALISRRK